MNVCCFHGITSPVFFYSERGIVLEKRNSSVESVRQ